MRWKPSYTRAKVEPAEFVWIVVSPSRSSLELGRIDPAVVKD
jgi:hypothetical protein